ncbi:MAG: glucose 1-dehydrogenase [Phycisphaerae bacterium]|nr:glucose 1-dehydrogenase [Phycisphaerae bacterium]
MTKNTMNNFRLDGRLAIVTGGSRGIGFGIAKGLGHAGAAVMISARRPDVGQEAVKLLVEEGIDVRGVWGDVADDAHRIDLVDRAMAWKGRIDVLVNNAGTTVRVPSEQCSLADFDRVIEVNVRSVFAMCQLVGRKMLEAGRGSIVNICSLTSEMSRPTIAAYASSKGAVRQLTRTLGIEWAARGVRVNGIGPGYIETDLTGPMLDNPELKGWVDSRIPMKRWGKPEDLAGAAVFLASAASSYLTGQVLYIDGGFLAG